MRNTQKANQMRTSFSVIIPCYNCEQYVETAIASVLKQSYPVFEVLAVDDGSTDNTLELLNHLALSDERIKVFHKPNGGYPSAVNFGLEHMNGDYFLMMGSDDELCSGLFANAVVPVRIHTPDMMVFKVQKHWIGEAREDEIDSATRFEKPLLYQGLYADFYRDNTYEASFFALRDTGKMFKRELLGNLRYFGRYGLDADGIFSLLFAHKSRSFYVMPERGFVWNLHKDSLSGRKLSVSTHIDRLGNWRRFLRELKKFPRLELCPIDFFYSHIGHEIISFLSMNHLGAIIRKYPCVISYYCNLRTLYFKNARFRELGLKLTLNSFFPICYAIIRKIRKNRRPKEHGDNN